MPCRKPKAIWEIRGPLIDLVAAAVSRHLCKRSSRSSRSSAGRDFRGFGADDGYNGDRPHHRPLSRPDDRGRSCGRWVSGGPSAPKARFSRRFSGCGRSGRSGRWFAELVGEGLTTDCERVVPRLPTGSCSPGPLGPPRPLRAQRITFAISGLVSVNRLTNPTRISQPFGGLTGGVKCQHSGRHHNDQ